MLGESWLERPLPDMDLFATTCCSDNLPKVGPLFQILRDLYAKREYKVVSLVTYSSLMEDDGHDDSSLFIEDDDIDLVWLHTLASRCRATGKDCYVCIYSSESVIYDMITTEL